MSRPANSSLTTENALLGFLHQQPMHGYEIHRRLSETEGLGLVWYVKQNQLYALLGKLEKKGYVTTTLEPQPNRPDRKVFHLTNAGRETFWTWLQSPVQHGRKLRLEFLAKLYFAQQEEPAIALGLIEEQRGACLAWLNTEHDKVEALEGEHPYERLVHQFRLGQLEAMLTWLDTCEQALPELTRLQKEPLEHQL